MLVTTTGMLVRSIGDGSYVIVSAINAALIGRVVHLQPWQIKESK